MGSSPTQLELKWFQLVILECEWPEGVMHSTLYLKCSPWKSLICLLVAEPALVLVLETFRSHLHSCCPDPPFIAPSLYIVTSGCRRSEPVDRKHPSSLFAQKERVGQECIPLSRECWCLRISLSRSHHCCMKLNKPAVQGFKSQWILFFFFPVLSTPFALSFQSLFPYFAHPPPFLYLRGVPWVARLKKSRGLC